MDEEMGYGHKAAKRTFYGGRWYDSNLEARVAEAMDDRGIAFEYQRRCFRDKRFPYGQYTPDFRIPCVRRTLGEDVDGDLYLEVAGFLDERHSANIDALARVTHGRSHVCVVDGDGHCVTYAAEGPEPDARVTTRRGWPKALQRVADAVKRP